VNSEVFEANGSAERSTADSSELKLARNDITAEVLVMQPLSAAPLPPVFVVGGRINGADPFDKPKTLTKLWPKLIKS
jgi:hypothetical protein